MPSSPVSAMRWGSWARASSERSNTLTDLVRTAPILRTRRLILDAPVADDAPELQRLAGAREVADTTLAIPHPYELDHALAWIAQQRREAVRGRATNFAVRLRASGAFIGSAGLRDIDREHLQAE